MIIDRIVTENFGVYGGKNEAVLTPPDPSRPITLFGGNNGAGKTTLLKALYLAFYGKRAPLTDRADKSYDDFLIDCIHSEANPHLGARVEVHFRKQEDGRECKFRVSRRWWVSPKGVEERLEVFEGLDKYSKTLSESWGEFIEDYLPARIANLFFFDGEQIKQLAARESAAELLRTAVQSLLGLEIVERLVSDLVVLERRKRQAAKTDPERRRLAEIEREVSRLEELHNAATLECGIAQTRLNKVRRELSDTEDRYVADGGSLLEQRGALKEERSRIETDLLAAEADLRDLAAGVLPYALATDMLTHVDQQMSNELQAGQTRMQAAILKTRDDAILGYLKRRKTTADILLDLHKWMEHDRDTRQSSLCEETVFNVSQDALDEVRALLSYLPSIKEQAVRLVDKVHKLQQELDTTDRRLAQVPNDEAIRKLHDAVTLCRANAHAAETNQAVCTGKRDQLFHELTMKRATYGRELEKSADSDNAADNDRRIIEHSARVRSTLESFRTAAITRRVGQLERLICESFCQLIRKQDFVTAIRIDPGTFEVHLLDPRNRVIPMSRLSAGESQLLATAMLWGLARASGRVVPTFIDTPLGRLDSSHRRHLVERYFPNAAHQVILLSTDEEINQCHLERLKPFIGNSYRLDYDPTTRSTKIQEGYFFS